MRRTLVTKACLMTSLSSLPPASRCAGGRRRTPRRGRQVYTAQKCSMCHAIAGKGSKANPLDGVGAQAVGRRHQAVDHATDRGRRQGQVDQEAADAGEVRQAARGRSRRARRLHAEPEVAGARVRIRALARHPLAIAGAVITTASAVVFITLAIAVLAGMFDNPYAGLVVFIAIPAVFVFGLLLIPAGMWLQRRKLLRDPTAVGRLAGHRFSSARRSAALPCSSSR